MDSQKLAQFSPTLPPFYEALSAACARFEIDDGLRLQHFLAQWAHETGGFKRLSENLNYSADGLQATFRKYFPTAELAAEYARQPEKIANRVYASRMGNGDEGSGDGWKFRGRGWPQLTGKDNYRRASIYLHNDAGVFLREPDLVAASPACVDVAGWFWQENNLNRWADMDDIEQVTRRVNGGLTGLEDRKRLLALAREIGL